jgi:hypothetical protein
MERKKLLAMASEAGLGNLLVGDGLPTMWNGIDIGMLEHFAGLVSEEEREACASLCDENDSGHLKDGARACAYQIRERSNAEVTRPAAPFAAGPAGMEG